MATITMQSTEYVQRLEQKVGKMSIMLEAQQEMIEKLLREAKQTSVTTDAPLPDEVSDKRPPALHAVDNVG